MSIANTKSCNLCSRALLSWVPSGFWFEWYGPGGAFLLATCFVFLLFLHPTLPCFAAFTAASILSSRIAVPTYAISEVRIVPKSCEFISFNARTDAKYNNRFGTPLYSRWSTAKSRLATIYARKCYGRTGYSAASCRGVSAQKLLYSTKVSATCSLKEDRCYLGQHGALEMSTNCLGSHGHPDINAWTNRIKFRRVVTCSVSEINDLISAFSG